MSKEIERKFLVKIMPDLSGTKLEEQERYFLELGTIEKRITKINSKYFYEEKSGSEKNVKGIQEAEFERLKSKAIKNLKRKNYILSKTPSVSIKVYGGEYEGLVRAEFEFETVEEARKFAPPEWVGKEITETNLGRDGELVQLKQGEFKEIFGMLKG